MSRAVCLLFVVASACDQGASSSRQVGKAADPQGELVGVYPEEFRCENLLPDADVASILAGSPRRFDSQMPVPRGVAKPCSYTVQRASGAEAWTFDLDCRDQALETAEKLFAQYRATSAANVAHYAEVMDAGIKRLRDAGPPPRAPEDAIEVKVGAKALDHHGQGLLVVDDDTPCYIRIVGPDEVRRMALAQLLVRNLTPERAPMTPRPAQR